MFAQPQASWIRSLLASMSYCLASVLALFAVSGEVVAQGKPSEKDLVKAEAHLSVDKLPAGDKCQILIRLTIQSDWHIGANPALDENGYPTKVEWKSKQGTKLTR